MSSLTRRRLAIIIRRRTVSAGQLQDSTRRPLQNVAAETNSLAVDAYREASSRKRLTFECSTNAAHHRRSTTSSLCQTEPAGTRRPQRQPVVTSRALSANHSSRPSLAGSDWSPSAGRAPAGQVKLSPSSDTPPVQRYVSLCICMHCQGRRDVLFHAFLQKFMTKKR